MTEFIDETYALRGLVTPQRTALAINKSLKQFKSWGKQVGVPQSTKDHIVSPIDADTHLRKFMKLVEKDLEQRVQRFSYFQWLWYLRRLPPYVFVGTVSTTIGYDFALAETLASKSKKKMSLSDLTAVRFDITNTIVDYVLEYCASIKFLSNLHAHLRWAGKNVPFRFKADGIISPLPDLDTKNAVKLYDIRVANRNDVSSGFGRMGTILGYDDKPSSEQVIEGLFRLTEPRSLPNLWQVLSGNDTSMLVPYRWLPYPINLEQLINLSQSGAINQLNWLDKRTSALITLLAMVFLITGRSLGASLSIPQYGYSLHVGKHFSEAYFDILEHANEVLLSKIPNLPLIDNTSELLDTLRQCVGSTYPLNAGPVITDIGNNFVIDYANATSQLNNHLQFPQIFGDVANQRAIHFENMVQSMIDATTWKPDDDLRQFIRRELKRDDNNKIKSITDLDAVGAQGKRLLIVSCKAEIYSAEYDIGSFNVIRNAANRVRDAVSKWQSVKQELFTYPKGRNYDLSKYNEIIAVVCTPSVVYTADKQSLEYEVDDLYRAAAASELLVWLKLPQH